MCNIKFSPSFFFSNKSRVSFLVFVQKKRHCRSRDPQKRSIMNPLHQEPPHIVIVGGGIIGCAILHYLVSSPAMFLGRITVVENCDSVGQCASGHAGGFLARNWCDGEGALERLSQTSFDLHCKYARGREHALGFRYLPAVSATITKKSLSITEDRGDERGARVGLQTNVLDAESLEDLTPEHAQRPATAQVNPGALCASFVASAIRRTHDEDRIRIRTSARVTKLIFDEAGVKCIGVEICQQKSSSSLLTERISATVVILALGPWTAHIERLLPSPLASVASAPYLVALSRSFLTLKVQSVVISNGTANQHHDGETASSPSSTSKIPPCAIFTYPSADSGFGFCEPEIYPRPDGTIYLCGLSDKDDPLPVDSSQVRGDEAKGRILFDFASTVLTAAAHHHHQHHLQQSSLPTPTNASSTDVITSRQELRPYSHHACYLPTPADRRKPIIGVIPESANSLFVASGHTCWGILNSHGTGLAMREMIQQSHPEMFSQGEDEVKLKDFLLKLQPSFLLENEVPEELRNKNATKRKNEKW